MSHYYQIITWKCMIRRVRIQPLNPVRRSVGLSSIQTSDMAVKFVNKHGTFEDQVPIGMYSMSLNFDIKIPYHAQIQYVHFFAQTTRMEINLCNGPPHPSKGCYVIQTVSSPYFC